MPVRRHKYLGRFYDDVARPHMCIDNGIESSVRRQAVSGHCRQRSDKSLTEGCAACVAIISSYKVNQVSISSVHTFARSFARSVRLRPLLMRAQPRPLALNRPRSIPGPCSPNKCLLIYGLTMAFSGSTRARTRKKSFMRGYFAFRSCSVSEWDLAQ